MGDVRGLGLAARTGDHRSATGAGDPHSPGRCNGGLLERGLIARAGRPATTAWSAAAAAQRHLARRSTTRSPFSRPPSWTPPKLRSPAAWQGGAWWATPAPLPRLPRGLQDGSRPESIRDGLRAGDPRTRADLLGRGGQGLHGQEQTLRRLPGRARQALRSRVPLGASALARSTSKRGRPQNPHNPQNASARHGMRCVRRVLATGIPSSTPLHTPRFAL